VLVENALSIIRSESTAMQKQLMTENKSATEFPKIRTAAASSAAASDARSYEICNDWVNNFFQFLSNRNDTGQQ
jgi:ectoine hydroxylase-related dioxygenase (phytanoyl-CoA dioxygenase family)